VLKAERESRKGALAQMSAEAPQPINESAAEEVDRDEMEWEQAKAEFTSRAAFELYKKAQMAGSIKVIGGK